MRGDQILLMAPEMSLLCSGEPTAETKSILDEHSRAVKCGEHQTPQCITAAHFGLI